MNTRHYLGSILAPIVVEPTQSRINFLNILIIYITIYILYFVYLFVLLFV